jgi:hypothetical protein
MILRRLYSARRTSLDLMEGGAQRQEHVGRGRRPARAGQLAGNAMDISADGGGRTRRETGGEE